MVKNYLLNAFRHSYQTKISHGILIIIFSIFSINAFSQTNAPSIQSDVSFQWAGPQPTNSSPAFLESITVDGVVYNDLIAPTGYVLNQVGPAGNGGNNILLNGTTVENTSASATWDDSALAAYQDRNLNHYFESNGNGASICDNFGAIDTTNSQKQTLIFDNIVTAAGSIIAVTERNANNCLHIEIIGSAPGTSNITSLGETFVNPAGGAFSGPGGTGTPGDVTAPTGNVDYWLSDRVVENGGTLGIALFDLEDIVPIGSTITSVITTAATVDNGDGKIFILDKDNDLDGADNVDDDDDDNDGILDVDERICSNTAPQGANDVFVNNGVADENAILDSVNSNGAQFDTVNDELVIDLGVTVPQGTDIEISYFASTAATKTIQVQESNFDGSVTSNSSSFASSSTAASTFTYTLLSDTKYIRLLMTVDNGGILEVDYLEIQSYQQCTDIDTDGDLIPDYLDTDSDNDGCPDALEGDGGFDFTDLDADEELDVSVTGIDANGVPNQANGGQNDISSTDSNVQAAICISDNDGDGIDDSTDVDDDNDGIPDTLEGDTCDSSEQTLDTNGQVTTAGGTSEVVYDASGLNVSIGDFVLVDNLLARGDLNSATETFQIGFNNETLPATTYNVTTQCGALEAVTPALNRLVEVIDVGGGTPGIIIDVDASADVGVICGGTEPAMAYSLRISCGLPSLDSDNDGIPDSRDLDSDNDGIPDNIEAQSTLGYIAPSGSGAGMTDANNNGLDDNYETAQGGTDIVPVNTDGADDPDYLDLDSDNDGAFDIVESGRGLAQSSGQVTGTVGNNGLITEEEINDNYFDVNGVFDNTQSDNFADSDGDVLSVNGDVDYRDDIDSVDTDGDGVPDTVDIDDDNDGILDTEECTSETANAVATQATTGVTNIANITGPSDGAFASWTTNGNISTIDFGRTLAPGTDITFTWRRLPGQTGTAQPIIDESLDGSTFGAAFFPISTTSEIAVTSTFQSTQSFRYLRITKQSTPSITDFDIDSIAITVDESACDDDGDGVPNSLDLDSDNDGIPDIIEAQPTVGYVAPSGSDDDNDGLDNSFDDTPNGNSNGVGSNGLTPQNTDGIDNPDYLDLDSDNDALFDINESGSGLTDANSDGRTDGAVGNNGLENTLESADNYNDVNGIFDDTQFDNFTDSNSNAQSASGDVDYREDVNAVFDRDGDGVEDSVDIDDDNDGILDIDEDICSGGLGTTGRLRYQFYDSVPAGNTVDNISEGSATAAGTGFVSDFNVANLQSVVTPADGDTFSIRYLGRIEINTSETYTFFTNSDDGSKLFIDGNEVVDNDGDHGPVENSGTIALTPGVYDFEVLFYENGGGQTLSVSYSSGTIAKTTIPFSVLGDGEATFCDTDGDGIENQFDLDSDNDGIPDIIEGQSTLGYVAPSGSDADQDGLDDAFDSTPNGGNLGIGSEGIQVVDTDEVGNPDYLDVDSDEDGLFDINESGSGLTDGNTDGRTDGVVGDNGLDNTLETLDTYADVNGSFDNTQDDNFTDADSDVNTGGDVDYRDDDVNVLLINANDDFASHSEGTTSNDLINVLDNDTLDGVVVTPADVTVTTISSDDPGITLDANGNIDVSAAVNNGTYELIYSICETASPSNCDTATVFVTVTNNDRDNDGVPDDVDIDDDNDGILDVDEGFTCPATDFVAIGSTFSSTADPGTQAGIYPFNGASMDYTYSLQGSAVWNSGISTTTNTGVDGVFINAQNQQSNVPNGDFAFHEFEFSEPVYEFEFKVGGLDNQDRLNLTASLDGVDVPITITDINLGADLVFNSPQSITSNSSSGNLAPASSVLITANGPVDTVNIKHGKDGANASNSTVQFYEFRYCTALDFDDDGIINSFDLDSDNDGIPDNIEAQSTTGYIAPSGGVGANGLFASYENNDTTSATGLTLTNTDGSLNPDYLDLDSDDDGLFDIDESGSGLTDGNSDGQTDGTVGFNGLDNSLESSDNYASAKGDFDNTQEDNFDDEDGDVNLGGDVDYRDITDNPRIIDAIDDAVTTNEGIAANDVINVLDNDTLDGNPVLISDVSVTTISSSDPGITVDPAGQLSVADTVPAGNYTLVYQICQTALPSNCDIATVSVTVSGLGIDTDGDGVIDSADIDDDNDGILDDIEESCPTSDKAATFVTTVDAFWTLDGNTNDVSGNGNNERALGGTTSPTYSTDVVEGTNAANFDGTDDAIRYSQDGGFMEATYTNLSFSVWIKPDVLVGDRIIYEEGGGTNGVTLWLDDDVLTYSARNGGVGSQTDIVHPTVLTLDGNYHHVAATFDSGTMNLYLDGIPATTVTTTFNNIPGHGSDGGLGGPIGGGTSADVSGYFDGLMDAARYSNSETWSGDEIASESELICDADGDGIANRLDLDSDNDGIPDIIEAQTTLGYTAPSGSDADGDGLDDNYDQTPNGNSDGTGSIGLSPENTDGTDNPDYLDLDSDNDSVFDIVESGSGLTDGNSDGRTDSAVGDNGLDNTLEIADDYSDVNGTFDNTQADNFTDTDGDVLTGGDVDYRDVPQIDAVDDVASALPGVASNGIINVLNNDTVDGQPATVANVDITQISTTNAGVTVDPVTGDVNVGAGVPEGVYTIEYRICQEATVTNCDSAFVTVTVETDTDGDGVPDSVDIDDDNDGILDTEECEVRFDETTFSIADGNSSTGLVVSPVDNFVLDILSLDNAFSLNVNGVDLATQEFEFQTDQTVTVEFADGDAYGVGGIPQIWDRPESNVDTPLIRLIIDDSGNVSFFGSKVTNGPLFPLVLINGNTFNTVTLNSGTTNTFIIDQDVTGQTLATGSIYGSISDCDFDDDGIPNNLDLDSDNDGIPDNIEAQSTTGYTAPLGVDNDEDGLDDAYDDTPFGNSDGTGSNGLDPENTDGTDLPDYLDIDSDNDGFFDIDESGDGLTDADNDGRTDGAVGVNGLDNTVDAGGIDDYSDVNGKFDDTQDDNFTDTDGDVLIGGDVDYRDIPEINAIDDAASATAGVASNGIINVLDNDTVDGLQATVANVDITQISTTNAGVIVDPLTGDVNVGAGVQAGVYTIEYRICQEGTGTTTNCDNAFVTVTVELDTDGDGVPDAVDIDDDNDGILDSEEFNGQIECNSSSVPVSSAVQGESNVLTGNTNFSAINDGVATADDGVAMNSVNHYFVIDLGQVYQSGSVIRLDIWGNGTQNRTAVTSETTGGTYIPGGGTNPQTNQVNVNTTSFYNYTLANETQFIQIDMTVRSGGRTEWIEATITNSCLLVEGDSDGDGIVNSLDLDSDNDGIPDNIESQSTVGYIAPTGLDDDGDGLDNAYDVTPNGNANGDGSIGITPENTDGTDLPDYLDTDSDNDGLFDIDESGDGLTDANGDGRTDGVVGNNGLEDTVDDPVAGDGYDDPSGKYDGTQTDNFTDTDGDVLAGGDVDYRDVLDFEVDMPTQTVLENNAFTSVAPTLTNSPGGTITYSLGGVDAADFTIDPVTGVVSMVARDFENPVDDNTNNFYNLTIISTSSVGPVATDDFTVIVNNECEDIDVVQNKLRATDPIGVASSSDNAVLQVEVTDASGAPRSGVQVSISLESGSASFVTTSTGTTDASGLFSATVSSTVVGTPTFSARYAATTGAPDTDVELGNPTPVRFLSSIDDREACGEVGIAVSMPHPSSVLEVFSEDKGVLIPSVALLSCSDTSTIPNPATSLLVYNTNASPSLGVGFVFFDGAEWRSICLERDQLRQ
ncbi:beta strand repeat-containing protein [Nonlabens spongiae]|nr:LamG-like jellyroll fold domain-containing protein [Nonlabens spongiae]